MRRQRSGRGCSPTRPTSSVRAPEEARPQAPPNSKFPSLSCPFFTLPLVAPQVHYHGCKIPASCKPGSSQIFLTWGWFTCPSTPVISLRFVCGRRAFLWIFCRHGIFPRPEEGVGCGQSSSRFVNVSSLYSFLSCVADSKVSVLPIHYPLS